MTRRDRTATAGVYGKEPRLEQATVNRAHRQGRPRAQRLTAGRRTTRAVSVAAGSCGKAQRLGNEGGGAMKKHFALLLLLASLALVVLATESGGEG